MFVIYHLSIYSYIHQSHLFLLFRIVRIVHELIAEEVVHVHALGPALLVPDLVLVLEVADDFGVAGQVPDQPPAVRCGVHLETHRT